MDVEESLRARLERAVRRVFPEAVAREHWRLEGGVCAEAHAVALELPDGRAPRLVIRRPNVVGGEAVTSEQATRELALLRVLHQIGLPVPEPYLVDAGGEIFPTPYLVMEFVEGTTHVSSADLASALEQMAHFLARLHQLDAARLGLPELPPRDEPIQELLTFLPPDAPPTWRDALRAIGPARSDNARALLHGDFWPGNLLWRDGRLVAVLDWEDSALGEPLSDLASTRLELLWQHGAAASQQFTERYLALSPISVANLPLWDLYVASAARTHMPSWHLPAEVEAHHQALAIQFSERAAGQILGL